MAARTRSRASRTALSARPTTVNAGSPSRMSDSTQTRRASTPSTANVMTRESISRRPPGRRRPRAAGRRRAGRASERGLQMVQPDEVPRAIHQHAHAVEAQRRAVRAGTGLGEPGDRHPADLGALARMEVVERVSGAGEAGLDLGEHERLAVEGHEVELAEPGAVVAREDLVAEALEVLCGQVFAAVAP